MTRQVDSLVTFGSQTKFKHITVLDGHLEIKVRMAMAPTRTAKRALLNRRAFWSMGQGRSGLSASHTSPLRHELVQVLAERLDPLAVQLGITAAEHVATLAAGL